MTDIIEILEHTQSRTEKEFDIVIEAMTMFNNLDTEEFYTESSGDSIKNFFTKIVNAIKKIIDKVKKSITDLFKRETVEKKNRTSGRSN